MLPKFQVRSSRPPSGGVDSSNWPGFVGVGGGALGSVWPGGTGAPGGVVGTALLGAAATSRIVTCAEAPPANRLSGLRFSGRTWKFVTWMVYCSLGVKVKVSAVGSRLDPVETVPVPLTNPAPGDDSGPTLVMASLKSPSHLKLRLIGSRKCCSSRSSSGPTFGEPQPVARSKPTKAG